MNPRLALGTVQFGPRYGVANRSAPMTPEVVKSILTYAWAAGVCTLDTAVSYGDCEQRLGDAGVKGWRVVTKLAGIPLDCSDVVAWVRDCVDGSLMRLRIPALYGLLVHQPDDIIGYHSDPLIGALVALQDEGKIQKIGVSVYEPAELDNIWTRFHPDLVQAPFNVFDRRIATSGWLTRLRAAGTEIHVRSIFLQGLLLMASADRPACFARWEPLWQQWERWLRDEALTPLQACLRFAFSQSAADRVVVGFDSLEQLRATTDRIEDTVIVPPTTLMSDDVNLIDPSRWSLA